jgi:hypothetical protein
MSITVLAREGCTCPRENGGRKITDTTPVTVPETLFYTRLIADGSLRIAVAPTSEVTPKGAKK